MATKKPLCLLLSLSLMDVHTHTSTNTQQDSFVDVPHSKLNSKLYHRVTALAAGFNMWCVLGSLSLGCITC